MTLVVNPFFVYCPNPYSKFNNTFTTLYNNIGVITLISKGGSITNFNCQKTIQKTAKVLDANKVFSVSNFRTDSEIRIQVDDCLFAEQEGHFISLDERTEGHTLLMYIHPYKRMRPDRETNFSKGLGLGRALAPELVKNTSRFLIEAFREHNVSSIKQSEFFRIQLNGNGVIKILR